MYDPEVDELGSGPRNLQQGESNSYIENGRLVKETNIGQRYL